MRRAVVFWLGLVALVAVQVAAAQLPKPCQCTQVWSPVCFEGKQFGNACLAKCAGVTKWNKGECGKCTCPAVWAPVCAKGKTFGNDCEAKCQGYLTYTQGACKGAGSAGRGLLAASPAPQANPTCGSAIVPKLPLVCGCPLACNPVCAEGKTYINSCVAGGRCYGKKWIDGKCGEGGKCGCPKIWRPVCAKRKTFANACDAKCQGYLTYTMGECKGAGPAGRGLLSASADRQSGSAKGNTTQRTLLAATPSPKSKPCVCLGNFKPVCSEGKTFSNACRAKCAGKTSWTDRACEDNCICPLFIDEVCAKGITFQNSCRAACKGYLKYTKGACKGPARGLLAVTSPKGARCICTKEMNPVCAKGKTFNNPCLAKCNGYPKYTMGACK